MDALFTNNQDWLWLAIDDGIRSKKVFLADVEQLLAVVKISVG